jgi:hypothetical protein
MPNLNSNLRKTRNAYFGWKEDGKYYLSIAPKDMNMARNEYASALDALKDASARHVAIVWDDPSVV